MSRPSMGNDISFSEKIENQYPFEAFDEPCLEESLEDSEYFQCAQKVPEMKTNLRKPSSFLKMKSDVDFFKVSYENALKQSETIYRTGSHSNFLS